MTACQRCGKETREVFPVDTHRPVSLVEEMRQPLSRQAMWVLGIPEPPWGEHPDDDQFATWCRDCVETIR